MPEFTLSRRRALVYALVLLALLVVAGRVVLPAGGARRESQRVAIVDSPTRVAAERARIVVHVVGAVRRPGLYELRDGARVADAVARAGGAGRNAELALVNLAAPVADGQQIVVPARAPARSGGVPATGAGVSGPLSLNSATIEQLDALPGVGPVTAQKIIDHREQHGAFRSVDDLDAIPGIGPARLEQLRALVSP